MIEGNVIRFGHGTVVVRSAKYNPYIRFRHIQPPAEVGANLTEGDLEEYTIVSELTFKYEADMKEVLAQLPHLAEHGYQLPFRGYVLDFTCYNEKSVTILREAIQHAMAVNPMLLAC